MIKMHIEDEFYTIHEVAKKLKISYLTVYRWIQAKKLIAIKVGKQYRVSKNEFEKFLKNG